MNFDAIDAVLQHRGAATAARQLVNAQDYDGCTALHIAMVASRNYSCMMTTGVVESLLRAGVDTTLVSGAGQMALQMAVAAGSDGAAALTRLGSVLSSSAEGRRYELHAELPRRWAQWNVLRGDKAELLLPARRRVSISLECNAVADAYQWIATFEPARTASAILTQALEALPMPSAAALAAALALSDGESVEAVCERVARHEGARHEAATASGEPEPALSAFRFYQLMFPSIGAATAGLSAAKRALAESKAWKAADAAGAHKRWCGLLEAADRQRFEREQMGV